jgi:hypothetical protein
MKVVDLNLYRNKKLIANLEKRIGELALSQNNTSVREMKYCFKEWLKFRS